MEEAREGESRWRFERRITGEEGIWVYRIGGEEKRKGSERGLERGRRGAL